LAWFPSTLAASPGRAITNSAVDYKTGPRLSDADTVEPKLTSQVSANHTVEPDVFSGDAGRLA
jgi:hypothetical protein